MEPETVIKSEVSQKEKNKYHVLMHMYEIEKSGTDEPMCRAGTETQTYECMDLGVGEGSGKNWETGFAIYTLLYVK